MSDYLLRGDAPIGKELWGRIDDMVVTVAKKTLVGRRVVELAGPQGWGVDVAPRFGFAQEQGATVATDGEYLRLNELAEEFLLRARHLAMAEQTPFGLDLGAVAIAAMKVAKAEDALVIGGLVAGAGAKGALGDWDAHGGPFGAVASAIAGLQSSDFAGPYALVLHPTRYAKLVSLMDRGRREVELVRELVAGGIWSTPAIAEDQALVLSQGAWNYDLVVGQDIVTAYLGNEGLDHRFRVFETVALRVKLHGAICLLS